MKKLTVIITILLSAGMLNNSCKTQCIQTIQSSPNDLLLPAFDLKNIKTLFASNKIDEANYQFYRLDRDELGFSHVRCYQFVDKLKVFSEELIFHFNQSGEYYLLSGAIIRTTGLDAKPSLRRDRAVKIFTQKLAEEKNPMIDGTLAKGCFDVEFGCIALDDTNQKFAKAWKVKPADKTHPYAYINDDTSEIIFFDTGMRTF